MPNFKQHALIGTVAGVGFNVLNYYVKKQHNPEVRFDLKELLFCAVTGCIAASLPDLIEPATNPNHRGFFHSIVVGITIPWLTYKSHKGKLDPRIKPFLDIIGPGYVSHLLADSFTSKGLPII